jgi:nitrate/TMAO reductase-like tetraheme cytochrome c subunit
MARANQKSSQAGASRSAKPDSPRKATALGRVGAALRRFFVPPPGSPRWAYVLPYAALGILTLALLIGGAYGWEYTNSPAFCGTTCHTMPPEFTAYEISPHARVACVECHIGREFVGNQMFRKVGDLRHVFATVFNTYEFPIFTRNMRPARATCERCHSPEKFSDDSLRVLTHYGDDDANTPSYTYLIMHTGGGSQRVGLGRGIHWHIENPIFFYAADPLQQDIPYIRVTNSDGTITEYVDVESDFDPAALDESQLVEMDCITCHNRITHKIAAPAAAVDSALAQGLIDASIPRIRHQAVLLLSHEYETPEQAAASLASLQDFYALNFPDYYQANRDRVDQAVQAVQGIYAVSVFAEQEVDWDTHPNNVGHMEFPGCFRCHDGAHLDADQQAVRLECNLCHAIPVVAAPQDFLVNLEISGGPEPESHLNPNWISLHRSVFDQTCSNCHTVTDAGGTSNTSFCSNSACHGNVFTFAGFDAPALRSILEDQIPTPAPTATPGPILGDPTFAANVLPLFEARCTSCHNATNPTAGLDLSSYEGALAGGSGGPVIVPGDAAGSRLVIVQGSAHFANLLPAELEIVVRWIEAGVP